MKRLFVTIPILISCLAIAPAQALTHATFFGMQTMIQLLPRDASGANDLDSVTVYRAMNVPVKNSYLGPGKSIISGDRILNFICAIRNGASYECSIIILRGSMVEMDPFNKKLTYHLEGEAADQIRLQFYLNQNEFKFTSTDGLFRIETAPGRFTMSYDATGVH